MQLSFQTAVYCASGGCDGGDDLSVYKMMHDEGLGDSTCQNYIAKGNGSECSPIHKCQNCLPPTGNKPNKDGKCSPVFYYPKYFLKEYGTIKPLNAKTMAAEIYARGPISCAIKATTALYDFGLQKDLKAREKVFSGCSAFKNKSCGDTDHVIRVVGFGVTDEGEPFWEIVNSWGVASQEVKKKTNT
jgi:hypothetical protein